MHLADIAEECVVLVNCLLETGCLIKIAEILTGQKGRNNKILQYPIIGVILFVGIYVNFYDGSRLFQLIHYVGICVIIKLRHELRVADAVMYTVISYIIAGAMELLVFLPYNIVCSVLSVEKDFTIAITIITFGVCCFLEKRVPIVTNRKWIDIHKKNIKIRYFVISVLLVFIFVFGFSRLRVGMSLQEGVYLIIALTVSLMMIYKLSGYQVEMDYHRQYEEKYGEVVIELRERQHKFMNQLDSVYALCTVYDNYEELVKHQAEKLEHLKKYLMPGKLLILERPLLVAHIYTKLCEAEEKQIPVHTEFSCSLEGIAIPDIFLIEIFGNLFDNAVEEVLLRQKGEKLRIAVFATAEEIGIRVGNEHDKIPYKEYSRFFQEKYSTKGDGRGVGLPYTKKIVEKYHGRIEIGNEMYGKMNYFMISVYFRK